MSNWGFFGGGGGGMDYAFNLHGTVFFFLCVIALDWTGITTSQIDLMLVSFWVNIAKIIHIMLFSPSILSYISCQFQN